MKPEPETGGGFWRERLRSFRFAARGMRELLRARGNARIHFAATIAVIVTGFALKVTAGEWSMLVLAIGSVWVAEGVNTAIELLADRVSREHDDLIGRAKDIAAGAVLLAALAAAIVGVLILGPRVWALLRGS